VTQLIQQWFGVHLWVWLLVFARVGSAFTVLPAFGDAFVPTEVRLILAALISLIVVPLQAAGMPPEPDHVARLLLLLFGEATIGFFIGGVARILVSALENAGTIIAMQTGLSNATVFNPAMASPGTLPGSLMGWLGLLLIFVTDLHHLMLASVVDSYTAFPAGEMPPFNDMADFTVRVVGDSFSIGVRLAAPFIAAGLVFAFALGLLSKLAPQIQVFFLFMSAQVALGLILLALALSGMMTFWLGWFEETLTTLSRLS